MTATGSTNHEPASGLEADRPDRGVQQGDVKIDAQAALPRTAATLQARASTKPHATVLADDAEPQAWTRERAQAWRAAQPPQVSPWKVVAVQLAVGFAGAAGVWMLGRGEWCASVLYGCAAVVVPNALLARGMTRGTRGAVAAAAGFLFWEMLKIGTTIAMLVIAAKTVPQLSWPVLLVTMVVCMKVNWFALLWRGR